MEGLSWAVSYSARISHPAARQLQQLSLAVSSQCKVPATTTQRPLGTHISLTARSTSTNHWHLIHKSRALPLRFDTGLQTCNATIIKSNIFGDANMTSQLLASELANLIQESKRKHNDLRQVRPRFLTTSYFSFH